MEETFILVRITRALVEAHRHQPLAHPLLRAIELCLKYSQNSEVLVADDRRFRLIGFNQHRRVYIGPLPDSAWDWFVKYNAFKDPPVPFTFEIKVPSDLLA